VKRRERKALEARYPELVQLARSAVPREACGLIEWDGTRMTLRSCENVATRPEDSFLIAPSEQLRHLAEIEAAGTEFWGVYHSHPSEGSAPSERDRAFATQLQVTWVIVGLGAGHPEFWVGNP
jgi:proteasome lid subunit RPN8/RPN11